MALIQGYFNTNRVNQLKLIKYELNYFKGIDDKTENSTLELNSTTLNNSTKNNTINKKLALFSPSVFYVIIGCILSICTIAYFLLNYLYLAKNGNPALNDKEENLENKQNLLRDNNNQTKFKEIYKITLTKKIIMFSIDFFTTFVLYGILPGLASYSTLPYGKLIELFILKFSLINNLTKQSVYHTDPMEYSKVFLYLR